MHDYGQIPFWSWNGLLKEERLNRQMLEMKRLGFGGFFMHARGGLVTKYMSEDWFDKIGFCIERANNEGMQPWVYDENGWPSGFADGKLLKEGYFISYLTLKEKAKFDAEALGNYKKTQDGFIRESEDDGNDYYVVKAVYNKTYVDLMNPNVAKDFVKEVHEKYKARFKNTIEGFFTDEPQYSREGIPWSRYLKDEYEKRTGKCVYDDLIYLFFENGDASKKIRYDYYNVASDLFIGFQKYLYEWCVENGYKITGHTIDENCIHGQISCCGEAMRFYEYETIPGIDWLTKQKGTNLAQKQCSSVAEQLGKEQVITETFGASGWDSTMKYLKRNVDYHLSNGVNLFCYHLYPYSVVGERKHDFPPFFSEHCSWMKNSYDFHEYVRFAGKLLGTGKKNVRLLVLHTILSAYMTFRRYEPESVGDMENALDEVCKYLTDNCVQYHLGSEKIIAKHGSVDGTRFSVGKASYDYVIVPSMRNLAGETYEMLKKYSENGGKLIIIGNELKYKDGVPFDFDLKPNAVLEEVMQTREAYLASPEKVYTYFSDHGDKKAFFVYNYGDTPVETKIVAKYDVAEYDFFDNACYKVEDNLVKLLPDESKIYLLGANVRGADRPLKKEYLPVDGYFRIEEINNYLPLDTVRYSFDNVNYSDAINVFELKRKLLSMRYEGDLYLKYTVANDDYDGKAIFVSEPNDKIEVFVNGIKAEESEEKIIDEDMRCFSLGKSLKKGANEIVEKIYYYQREEVYYVLFTDGISETLKNKLFYDTELDSAYLYGKFRVNFSDAIKNERSRRIKDFSLTTLKEKIDLSDISKEGFPFIAGRAVVSAKIPKIKGRLSADFTVQTIGVFVNGEHLGQLFGFNDVKIDADKDENELKLVIDFNLRNLFGPLHEKDDEPSFVTPDSFYEIADKDEYSIIDRRISDIRIYKD